MGEPKGQSWIKSCLSVSVCLSDNLSVFLSVKNLPLSPVVRPWEKEGGEERIVTMEETLDFNTKYFDLLIFLLHVSRPKR